MPGLIPPDKLDQVRAASDIVEIIGGSVRLKRAGAAFVGLCPFHREKTPSFHVNPQRQIFHCFGCHKGGDVFRFIQEFEHVTFIEAVQRLADRARIALPIGGAGPSDATRALRERLLQIHDQIAQRWQTALRNDAGGEIARAYLRRRGVSDDAITLFRVGYAPDAWDDTVNWAKAKGHDLEVVEKAGLIIRRDSGGYYDRFRGRLMFPICDEQGRVVAFSGRVLQGDEKTAKYVNSPETAIFTKGRLIFGLDKSKRALLDTDQAVICEGQLDLIACYMAGVRNVAAPQGTALTADHVRILKRYVHEVVLCFDADAAGQQATIRAMDELLASGLAIRVAIIPPPHDPDSFIREHGPEAFRVLLERAVSFFDFYLEHLSRQHDLRTDRGRTALVQAMGDAMRKAQNAVLSDTYTQRTAQLLGVASDAVRAEFQKIARRKPSAPQTAEPEPVESTEAPAGDPPSAADFWLLRFALLHEDGIPWLAAHLDLSWVNHSDVREILAARLDLHRNRGWSGVAALLTERPPHQQSLISEAVAIDRPLESPDRQIRDVVQKLRVACIDRQLAQSARELARPGLDEQHQLALLRMRTELQHARRQPLPE